MPPKNQPKKGKTTKQQDEEEKLLEEYAKAAAAAAATQPAKPAEDAASRKAATRAKLEEHQKSKSQTAEKQIEQRLQQQRLQAMLRALMEQREQSHPFSTEPNTTIESDAAESDVAFCAYAAMQGWRSAMEDAHVMIPDFDARVKSLLPASAEPNSPLRSASRINLAAVRGLYAVFDGHGGDQASKKCAAALPALVATAIGEHYAKPADQRTSPANLLAARVDGTPLECDGGAGIILHQAYRKLDDALKNKLSDDSGATAVSVIVTNAHVICASVGDSRALLCRKDGTVLPLAFDHKPEEPQEKSRIEAAGGHVQDNRVNGRLAMSRAVGDHQYKQDTKLPFDQQLVTCVPDVRVAALRDDNGNYVYDWLVVACDGIFDVMSNEAVASYVHLKAQGQAPSKALALEIAKAMTVDCLAPKAPEGGPSRAAGTDNMTVLVVALRQ